MTVRALGTISWGGGGVLTTEKQKKKKKKKGPNLQVGVLLHGPEMVKRSNSKFWNFEINADIG